MLKWVYLYRNLTRNVTRTILTCAAVGLPIVIFVLSMAVIDGVERFLANSARQLRLAVTQKTSIINPLPEGHRRKIESLDPSHAHIVSVCGLRWIGGQRPNDPSPLSSIGVDADTFVQTFPEEALTQKEIDAWIRDKQAMIVGRNIAAQCGWKPGDRVTINPSVPPYVPIEFHVISIAQNAEDPVTLFFHREYLEEIIKQQDAPQGLVSFYFVKCASNSDMNRFRQEIDRLFTGSLDETKTQDEKTFMNEFITQQFDLPRNLTILCALTVFVAVGAAMNTMSMNFRDRINEIATLKSLGFSGSFSFSLIQIESLFVCSLGGLIGAAVPYIAFTHTPLKNVPVPVIQSLEILPITCIKAFCIAVFIGLTAGLWPSWQAMRMKVVSALRNLE